MENDDISKSVIIMLVITSVIISLLGTWTVLEESKRISANPKYIGSDSAKAEGKISLSIVESPKPSMATGKITLQIIEQGE